MLRPTNPTSSLMRLFSVGDKMRTSFPFTLKTRAAGDSKCSTFDLSSARHELLTSDQPYVMTRGLGDSRCIVAFPISPRFAFVATHDREMESRLLNLGVSKIARAINESVVGQAERHVYGRTSAHLAFVEKRLRRPD